MMRCGVAVIVLACAALAVAGAWQTSSAASSFWTHEGLDSNAHPARLRLLVGGVAAGDPASLLLGLEFEILAGWKIYWRTPGDAGYPPEIDWAGSENIDAPAIRWPVPERFHVLGLETLGYHDGVVLPIAARLKDATKPTRLRAKISYLVCDEICIPGDAVLSLDLGAADLGAADLDAADLGEAATARAQIIQALTRVPGDGVSAGLAIERAEYSADDSLLAVTVRSVAPLRTPDLYVEGPENYFFAAPSVHFWEGKRRAIFRLAVEGPDGASPKQNAMLGMDLRLTLVDGLGGANLRAAEVQITVAPANAAAFADLTFVAAILLAILGGLILNLMPCVLPVLSLKLLAIAGHGGAPRAVVRKSFLATSAGILFAFLILATLIFLLRSAGQAVGWGFQFQSPFFVLFMVVLLVLFAANLLGFFVVRMPVTVQTYLAARGHGEGSVAHFLTGMFATVLATPCSAPFLGTSIGFALSRGAVEIYAIFVALGLGLAIPYLLIVLFPGLATRLPRPGPWMGGLRRVLGVALLATAVWLLTVFAGEVGTWASLIVGALMAGLLLAVGLRERFSRARPMLTVLAALFLGFPFLLTAYGPTFFPSPDRVHLESSDGPWQTFDLAAIPGLVSQGKLVFVDVTADWCITCQANKVLILNRGEAARRLRGRDVVAMRADWTRPNEKIAAYLAQFGRFGIPFNVVYGPSAPAGIPLPELLTQNAVREAMARAKGAE